MFAVALAVASALGHALASVRQQGSAAKLPSPASFEPDVSLAAGVSRNLVSWQYLGLVRQKLYRTIHVRSRRNLVHGRRRSPGNSQANPRNR